MGQGTGDRVGFRVGTGDDTTPTNPRATNTTATRRDRGLGSGWGSGLGQVTHLWVGGNSDC